MSKREAPPLLGWYEHHVHPDIVEILRSEFKPGDIINITDVYEKLEEVTGTDYKTPGSFIHLTKAMDSAFPGIFKEGMFRSYVQKPGSHHKGHVVPDISSEEANLVHRSQNAHAVLTQPALLGGKK